MEYATERDQEYVVSHLYPLLTSKSSKPLKLLLCGIEGIYIESLFKSKEEFNKFHLELQRLFDNKNNARFMNR